MVVGLVTIKKDNVDKDDCDHGVADDGGDAGDVGDINVALMAMTITVIMVRMMQ